MSKLMIELPRFIKLSEEMKVAGDNAVRRAREDGCCSAPVLQIVFFEAAIQEWLDEQEELLED